MTGLDIGEKNACFDEMKVLIRDSLTNFSSQVPAVLFLTDNELFYGGCVAFNDGFKQIPFAKIIELKLRGKSFFRCLNIVFEEDAKEKNLFIAPFLGEPEKPMLDVESLEKLYARIKSHLESKGVRI